MAENCKNCNEIIERNFCANCGQKKYKRIDKKYIWDEVQYTFLHANKGLLFSVKNILKNPGKTAREFIDGNRVNHYKPILLAFVLSGISAFLSYKILHMEEVVEKAYDTKNPLVSPVLNDYFEFVKHYSTIITVAFIPFFALTTVIPFRKWGHNYYEHIVMNAFFMSYYMLITILFLDPILFFFRHSSSDVLIKISSYQLVLVPFLLAWFFRGFYHDKTLKSIIIKILAVVALIFAVYVIISLVVGILFFIYALSKNPELLRQAKPH